LQLFKSSLNVFINTAVIIGKRWSLLSAWAIYVVEIAVAAVLQYIIYESCLEVGPLSWDIIYCKAILIERYSYSFGSL
jgi:hypothetical protein